MLLIKPSRYCEKSCKQLSVLTFKSGFLKFAQKYSQEVLLLDFWDIEHFYYKIRSIRLHSNCKAGGLKFYVNLV